MSTGFFYPWRRQCPHCLPLNPLSISVEGQQDSRCKTFAVLEGSITKVSLQGCQPWPDQKGFSFPTEKCLPSPAGSTSDIMTSDHSPVFATFEAGVTSQFVSKNGKQRTVSVYLFSSMTRSVGSLSLGNSPQSTLEEGSFSQSSPQYQSVSSCPSPSTISVQRIYSLCLANMSAF